MGRELLVAPDFEGDVTHFSEPGENGDLLITSVQDVAPIIERNKRLQTLNDGYSPSRELRRVAFIPDVVRLKWLNEEGWDVLDPACSDRLMRKLNDADWAWLRTDNRQQLGMSNGRFR